MDSSNGSALYLFTMTIQLKSLTLLVLTCHYQVDLGNSSCIETQFFLIIKIAAIFIIFQIGGMACDMTQNSLNEFWLNDS